MALWRQAESFVLRYIRDHKLTEGSALPADRWLADKVGCSLQPILRAMDQLARRGLVRRRPGAVTVVGACQPIIDDHEFSFGHTVREVYGRSLVNKVVEVMRRTPERSEPYEYDIECEAQGVLGLRRRQPFLVIARLRIIDGRLRAFHRAYLNPAHFPDTFLHDYDFEHVSLIDAINQQEFRIQARRTALRARFPTEREAHTMRIDRTPVLEATQELQAVRRDAADPIPIEFMHACYVDWRYHMSERGRSPK